jgi:hypothetical protein
LWKVISFIHYLSSLFSTLLSFGVQIILTIVIIAKTKKLPHYEEADATEMKQLWDSAIESCKKRAKKAKCCWYWHSCCSDCIALISADAYDNGFARFKKVDFTNMKDTEEL